MSLGGGSPGGQTLEHLLGRFVRDLPPLFTEDKAISFDPVQMTLLQKLVRQSALGASISVAKQDFFTAIVYLDTFAEVLAGRPTLLEDTGLIVEELERRHAYLDPDLELLVRYSLVHIARDLGGERFFRKAIAKQVHKRHELANKGSGPTPAPPEGPTEHVPLDLFDEAVGRMAAGLFETTLVISTLRDEVFTSIPLGRSDLRLAIVADGLARVLQQGPSIDLGEEGRTWPTLSWPDRALLLLQLALEREGGRSLADHIDALQRRLASPGQEGSG